MSFRSKIFPIILVPVLIFGCTKKSMTPADYVNPFIGTGGHGHTYPGASLPFGMVQLSPDTRLEGWDGCSGYHASDRVIYGFSHTHLSGTGCLDYGDILVMPVSVDVDMKDYGYASSFRSVTEVARPGYYSVELDKYKIRAELTTTLRAGFHSYTFPESEKSKIIFDLKHRDKVIGSGIRVVSKDEIEGYRCSQSWAQNQMVYFVAKFSKPFDGFTLYKNDSALAGSDTSGGTNLKAAFHFLTVKGEKIMVKVGISAVSTEGARRNLNAEITGWDFDTIAEKARNAWNRELGKITIEGGTKEQLAIFYTALYHAMLNPNLYTDVDRQYRGRDFKVHTADGFDYYTLFSLWDTYRAAHPLLTILDEKRSNDFINTFIRQYQEGGMLPVWELSANETGCMIGYHSVPVIWDAWQKGIRNYDARAAFEAMKHSAEQDHLGLK
jgi:predicted alpha-1,2-mannosidase